MIKDAHAINEFIMNLDGSNVTKIRPDRSVTPIALGTDWVNGPKKRVPHLKLQTRKNRWNSLDLGKSRFNRNFHVLCANQTWILQISLQASSWS